MCGSIQKLNIMEDRGHEPEDKDFDMALLSPPIYPLPQEIQQMERSETVCQYCGVSYLILHEFHQLQTKLARMEAELQEQREALLREQARREALELGRQAWEEALRLEVQERSFADERLLREELERRSVETERVMREGFERREEERRRALEEDFQREREEGEESLRRELEGKAMERERTDKEETKKLSEERERFFQEELRKANTLLDEGREHLKQLVERLRISDTEREESKGLLGMEREQGQMLRGRCGRQQQALAASLSLLHSSAQELQDVRGFLGQLAGALQHGSTQIVLRIREAFTAMSVELSCAVQERQRGRSTQDSLEQQLEEQRRCTEKQLAEQRDKETQQRDTVNRLSEELRETGESWSSCQRRCAFLQEQLSAWQRREEGAMRRCSAAEEEVTSLTRALEQAREENRERRRESERLEDVQARAEYSKMEELRQEMRSKLEASLEEHRTQEALRRREREEGLRREVKLELAIDREKSQSLLQLYQTEGGELRRKLEEQEEELRQLRSRADRAEEELQRERRGREEERRGREQEERRALQTSQQQGALELSRATAELCALTEQNTALQEEVVLLQETVRRECQERGELTAALTQAREQILGLRTSASPLCASGPQQHLQSQHHSPQDRTRTPLTRSLTPRHTLRPSPPYSEQGGGRGRDRVSVASWHGSGAARGERAGGGTLPQLTGAGGEVQRSVRLVMGRKERL